MVKTHGFPVQIFPRKPIQWNMLNWWASWHCLRRECTGTSRMDMDGWSKPACRSLEFDDSLAMFSKEFKKVEFLHLSNPWSCRNSSFFLFCPIPTGSQFQWPYLFQDGSRKVPPEAGFCSNSPKKMPFIPIGLWIKTNCDMSLEGQPLSSRYFGVGTVQGFDPYPYLTFQCGPLQF